jgi:hypothetical protein
MENEKLSFSLIVLSFLIIGKNIAFSSFDSCNKPVSLFLGRMVPSSVNYQLTKQADD